ncbi:helix-turn-helix transcriptional regulator [Amycolatopsis acidicola]|uniref:Helix-turn-helix transcriptional regulator n=1 Tax=Amycolatopsis acidicola TaxID=2596893 RepID=A0A5N0UY21_9PSEU|nr:helix-turn-helix domain-containing protein [Amycolatopsis acidicola]KAA9154499.1 helix-turn-helix transcriptional regulator [Amycolatopsis acidicola]
MAELPPRRRVRDAELMRALAHPLRSALLGYLMSVGPRTASECAAAVDSTASNCSWHLRQLAQWGLVERVEGTDGRERPWRANPVGLDFGELDGSSERLALAGTWLREAETLAQRFLDSADTLEPEWRGAVGMNTYALRLTPAELEELNSAIDALVRPYVGNIRENAPADARVVHADWRAFPRIDADGSPS